MEMGTWKKLILLLFILLFTVSSTISQPDFFAKTCSDRGNYTTNSPYQKNLHNILSSVSSSTQLMNSGFYNSSSGQEPDKVNVIALCRGDVLVQDCRKCINDSSIKILEVCPNQKEATGWSNENECMIRYSNTSIFGVVDTLVWTLFNNQNASNPIGFTQALRNLTDRLRNETASGNSLRKFAVGQIQVPSPSFDTIYELVQCTPDLSYIDCTNCVAELASRIPVGRKGGRAFSTTCYLRFETYITYNLQPPPPPADSDGSPAPLPLPPPPSPLSLPPIQDFFVQKCSESGNYTINSPYKKNLDNILSSVSSNTQLMDSGFYSSSSGEEPDKVNVIAFCRGDISVQDCRKCINDSSIKITEVCPNQKEATGWSNENKCMLHYSNTSILDVLDTPVWTFSNSRNTTNPIGFTRALRNLTDTLTKETASGNSLKFAVGQIRVPAPSFETLYGLAQCTPDLSFMDCNNCIVRLDSSIPAGHLGAIIFTINCYFRYDIDLFYNLQAPKPTTPPPAPLLPPSRGKNTRIIVITISTVAATAILFGLSYYAFFCRNKSHERDTSKDDENDEDMHYFSLRTLKAATDNFSDANKLGEGGFGPVYKGKLISGEEIAVKRLSAKSSQGHEEFKNEAKVILKLQHKNLVRLLGCCLEGIEKLLVYEYMANTSLDAFLFDPLKCKQLDWHKRENIINGIARGIMYLHEDSRLKIIHRDMKASNILLDDEMNPKISDFGTARIFGGKQIDASTNRIVGTYGYMAPEYAMEGLFSVKSDVYSFGVLMLEVISGRKSIDFFNVDRADNLLSYAWELWNEGKALEMIDKNLAGDYPMKEALKWIHIGLLCVQEDPKIRPTMSMVVVMLGSQSIALPQPSKPPFLSLGGVFMSDLVSKTESGTRSLSTNQ